MKAANRTRSKPGAACCWWSPPAPASAARGEHRLDAAEPGLGLAAGQRSAQTASCTASVFANSGLSVVAAVVLLLILGEGSVVEVLRRLLGG
jgi:hypothetical protein